MSDPSEKMEQLTGLDASFLTLETENAPMHIGGASLLDVRLDGGKRLDFDGFRAFLATRLDTTKVFRQRLAEVPLGLGKPYWVEDDAFDLDRHLERTQLPEPGGWRELAALIAWEFSRPLPRDRPLWQIVWAEGVDDVDGVPKGSVALIGKVHHAAIDGVSGAEILSALFELTPEPSPVPESAPWRAAPVPGAASLVRRAGRNLLGTPRAVRDAVRGAVTGVARQGAVWSAKRVKPPPMPFTAPRSKLNGPVSKERVWGGAVLDLGRVKAVKDQAREVLSLGITVNDVVLATVSGALRAYLDQGEALPEKPMVAMVPVSVRPEEEQAAMGNQVSAMLVQLATDEDDPLARLGAIHQGTRRAKTHHQALGARTLGDVSQVIPFGLAGVAARLYTRMELADRHRPLFNLVVTNVPGPPVPLYLAGARLVRHLGGAPIFDGIGLTITVFSYAGTIAFGAISCRRMMPDIEVFARELPPALDALASTLELDAS